MMVLVETFGENPEVSCVYKPFEPRPSPADSRNLLDQPGVLDVLLMQLA